MADETHAPKPISDERLREMRETAKIAKRQARDYQAPRNAQESAPLRVLGAAMVIHAQQVRELLDEVTRLKAQLAAALEIVRAVAALEYSPTEIDGLAYSTGDVEPLIERACALLAKETQ